MKLIESSIIYETSLDNMQVGQIGILTTGCYSGQIMIKTHAGFIDITTGELYQIGRQTNVKIYPKGTKLTFEV